MSSPFDFDAPGRSPRHAGRPRRHQEGSAGYALWVLVVLAAVGVLVGSWAFYHFAVYLPWLERVKILWEIEADQSYGLHRIRENNASGRGGYLDSRERYESQAISLGATQAALREIGAVPQHPEPPPYVPPAKRSD